MTAGGAVLTMIVALGVALFINLVVDSYRNDKE